MIARELCLTFKGLLQALSNTTGVCFSPPALAGLMRDGVTAYTPSLAIKYLLWGVKQWLKSMALLVVVNDSKVTWCKSLLKVAWE